MKQCVVSSPRDLACEGSFRARCSGPARPFFIYRCFFHVYRYHYSVVSSLMLVVVVAVVVGDYYVTPKLHNKRIFLSGYLLMNTMYNNFYKKQEKMKQKWYKTRRRIFALLPLPPSLPPLLSSPLTLSLFVVFFYNIPKHTSVTARRVTALVMTERGEEVRGPATLMVASWSAAWGVSAHTTVTWPELSQSQVEI